MTEAEWQTMSTGKLISRLPKSSKLARRRRRLVMAGVCRLLWEDVPSEAKAAVEAVELYVDGMINLEQLEQAYSQNADAHELRRLDGPRGHTFMLSAFAGYAAHPGSTDVFTGWNQASKLAVATAIRDICRPYFFWITPNPAWCTSTVIGLAEAIYDERAFDRLPILADALQDAGCEDADVLAHCRGDAPHVRGCWVVDLVLGKE